MTLTALTAMNAENITQSDTTEYDPPLKFLAVFAVDGVIEVKNQQDVTVTYTIPSVANGGGAPFILPGLITKVMATNTTIADSALVGYR